MQKINKSLKIIGIFTAILISAVFIYKGLDYNSATKKFDPFDAMAATFGNVAGFAWSENIGWISFNSNNCNIDGDAIYEGSSETGAPVPFPAGCPTSGTVFPYGINLDSGTGVLSGYAWNENIGWITFGRSIALPSGGNPPSAPYNSGDAYLAKLDGANLTGWARAISACSDDLWNGTNCTGLGAGNKSGGWDGWIKFSDGGTRYNVSKTGTDFSGWAWGSDVVGWISFNSKNCDSDGNGTTDTVNYAGCTAGISGVKSYKVYMPNASPVVTAPATNRASLDFCVDSPENINLSWAFNDDEEGMTQSAYKVKITRSSDSGSDVCDSGKQISSFPSITGQTINDDHCSNFLRYDSIGSETYSWEVTVYDSAGASSAPLPGPSFSFPRHRYPDVDFSPRSSLKFAVNVPVQFCTNYTTSPCSLKSAADKAKKVTCYGNDGSPAACASYVWDFDTSAVSSDSLIANPTHAYTAPGSYVVKLTVSDDVGTCSKTTTTAESLIIAKPKWNEAAPR